MDFSLYSGQLQSKEVILRRRIQYTDVLETLTVNEAMEKSFISVEENETLEDTFSLLYLHKISSLLVVNENNDLVGIISATDFQKGFSKGTKLISDAMTKDLIVVYPNESLRVAFDRLTTYRIENLPVVDKSNPTRIVGILSFRDIENRYETEITKLQLKRKLTIEELEDDI